MICFMYAPLLMFLKNPPHKTDQEKMENSVSTTDHNFFAFLCGISFLLLVKVIKKCSMLEIPL